MRGFWIYVRFEVCQGSEYSRTINMPGLWISSGTQVLPIFVSMAEFWICVGVQLWKASEYSRIPNMIPNMPGFCLFEGYRRFKVCLNMVEKSRNKLFQLWQVSEYAWSKFHRVLNMPPVLNMQELGIWQGCKYTRVTQGFEHDWICLSKASVCLNIA